MDGPLKPHSLSWLVVALVGSLTTLAPAFAQERDQYHLTADLNPETHEVEAEMVVELTNRSQVPLSELTFHLYLNAFSSDRTVFMRESGGFLRGDESDGHGEIQVHTLRVNLDGDVESLLDGCERELVPLDFTQLRCPLPQTWGPGETLTITSEFTSVLPPVFARSGYDESFHMVAQWFPKPAFIEPDGRVRSFPYHGRGEFYAEFADYKLDVIVPEGFEVGAVGEQLSRESSGEGRQRFQFLAPNVHDSAFTAWDQFDELTSEVGDTSIRVLFPAGGRWSAEEHLDSTERALTYFSEHFGPYPYPTLTVVVPPRSASGAAGMEYPTLFLTSGSWFSTGGFHANAEATTIHELAHQWFQGMVATDEVRFPMLDEGLTQWATGEYLRHEYGRGSGIELVGVQIDMFELMRLWSTRGDTHLPPGEPAHHFRGFDYGASVYGRTALVLETVARVWGRERLLGALGDYARTHRFGHPTPAHFFEVLDQHYWRGFSENVLRPALMEGLTADVRVVSLRSSLDGEDYLTLLDAHRVTELPIPLAVRLTTADGQHLESTWPSAQKRFQLRTRSDARVVRAEIDPHRQNLLDRNRMDNRRGAFPRKQWFAPILQAAQRLLMWLGP